MKLSNTMIMTNAVLPSNKKAFTLAEVLITLSILGVVAALTIPSLVNRQSEMAAIVKMKKAISQYEQVAEVYMAENEATSFYDGTNAWTCASLKDYFKMVGNGTAPASGGGCIFQTADRVLWAVNGKGNAVVYDSEKSPKFGVALWTAGGVANGSATNSQKVASADVPTVVPTGAATGNISASPTKGYFNAATMLKINGAKEIPTTKVDSITTSGDTVIVPVKS